MFTNYPKRVITLVLAGLLATGSVIAEEQAADAVMEEVVVTGIRSSVVTAMDTKRDSDGVVDSISAEDIGLEDNDNDTPINLRAVRDNAEKNAIIQALSINDNNVTAAAKSLGVTRPTIYGLMKKYDIS